MGKKEKHEEQVQFAAYKQFCDDTTTEKQRAIKEGNAKMEQLSAAIQKAEADAATLSKAIAGLKKQAYDRSQAELMQVNSLKLVPEHAKKVISAFLAQGDELGQDPMSVSAPQANAYEFQSQGVVDMLEKL